MASPTTTTIPAGGGGGGEEETTTSSSSTTFTVRVMTFNIQQLYDMGPKTWWDQAGRAKRIPAAIRSYCCENSNNDNNNNNCPDVLILNEAFNSYASKIANQLQDIFPYQTPVIGKSSSDKEWKSTTGCFRTGFTIINGGVMILSKHPIEEQRQYIYKSNHPSTWDCWSNKGICYTKILITPPPGQGGPGSGDEGKKKYYPVHVLGTHLQADEGHVPFDETHRIRMEQLREVRQFLENEMNLPREERVIFGGDLNVEYTTDRYRKDLEETLGISPKDTKKYYEHSFPGSFCAQHNFMTKANARANNQSEQRNETLDYVLVPSYYAQPTKQEPAIAKVVPLKSKETWYWNYLHKQFPENNGMTNDLSDHYPVVAVFEYDK